MTRVIAHRGASARELENSLRAFRAALELGADGIELDVHSAADGTMVVHHDPVVGGRSISQMTAREAGSTRLENGGPLPLLSNVLDAVGTGAIVYVEIKTLDPRWDESLMQVLTPADTECHIHAFDHRIVKRLHDGYPGIECGVLSSSYLVDPTSQLSRAGAAELWQEEGLIDDALVEEIHSTGGRIIAWTVNEEDRMAELSMLGVDGICTNLPDVARKVIK